MPSWLRRFILRASTSILSLTLDWSLPQECGHMPRLPNAKDNIPPAVLRLFWQCYSLSVILTHFSVYAFWKAWPQSNPLISNPRLRFMQLYILSSRLRAAEGEGSSHFLLPFISEFLCCCHPSQFLFSVTVSYGSLGPQLPYSRREQPISNSCQPHRYTKRDQQLPSGNTEHQGLGCTLGILTYCCFSQILQYACAERLGLPTEILKTQAPCPIQWLSNV